MSVGDQKQKMVQGPLAGVRVLDLSRILAGPTCTQLLGDLGADIIKVERPGVGDDTRTWGPPFVQNCDGSQSSESAYYLSANRNKRSIALDISNPDDAETVRQLAETCDLFVENFKVGGLAKYGLDFATLSARCPQLIYCSISGFGQTGPNAHRPGYDLLAQGFGGIMSLTGEPEGEPMKVAVGISDVMTGMYAATSLLAALHHRGKTGEGQHIDLGLADVQTAWLVNEGTNYLLSGKTPVRRGNQHPNIVPYQVFEVADGHLIVAVGNDAQFVKFCAIIGRNDIAKDERFIKNADRLLNREELVRILRLELLGVRKADLLAQMEAEGIPGGPINTLPELFGSEQVAAREMRVSMQDKNAKSGHVELIGNPAKLSKTPVTYRRAPPRCGADTDEILRELEQFRAAKNMQDFDDEQVARLRPAGE
ncbi:CaiB/BaiF CoA transferase family protein [Maritalea porphyrae]|jgi:crotonobetainyl-CoA:carnitine CoA-transferase CaiB-like acyl-CoA transferase|uniref:CaiB/BaiF CoA transferase family protein n=1 Tax=Maritalea porphyrae TaxID=880732 RepID=UPI0022AE9B8C|nr:CaiB/BaiF CoA-transferase family protein [Maritalea porphyrae]MCZ4271264.1 CaiB/BaiF CoA-transferase family protein [Maritalea porphyrae]